jgi:hypothetical protein
MGPLGIPELLAFLIPMGFGLIPIIAGIWALVTLIQIRRGQDAIRGSLERIEQQLRNGRPA